ncbi:hypothetical protein HYDPIDRAFT_164614 [Hydnomerulius pinastri MD-312]|nr:hypothetical protein HYDPIDRAFT_164614 [Hydnomerulius pinastri MD-312]
MHPGQIVLKTQVKQCTKVEKAADDKCLKDAQAAKAQAGREGISHLTEMELAMEEKQAQAKKPTPVHPHPWAHTAKGSKGEPTVAEASNQGDVNVTDVDGITDQASSETQTQRKLTCSESAAPSSGPQDNPEIIGVTLCIKPKPLKPSLKELINQEKVKCQLEASKERKPTSVKKWAANVKATNTNSVEGTTSSISSMHASPLTSAFKSAVSQSSNNTSLSNSSKVPQVPENTPKPDDTAEVFSDVNNREERTATVTKGVKGRATEKILKIAQVAADSDDKLDGKILISDLVTVSGSTKRKVDDTELEIISDSKPDEEPQDDNAMEVDGPAPANIDESSKMIKPVSLKALQHCTTTSTSVGLTRAPLPQRKKIKLEETDPTAIPTLVTSSVLPSQAQGSVHYDAEGYIIKLDDDDDIPKVAATLFENCGYLQEDPDKPATEHLFCSSFILELIASTHLNDISGYVDVLQWNTKELAAGKDMEGVIGMATAALEHAVLFIMDGTINIEEVLATMAGSPNGRMKISLPKMLNKSTGKESSDPYNVLGTNWGGNTQGYKEAILKRGAAWVHATFVATQWARNKMHAGISQLRCGAIFDTTFSPSKN